jgi:hypothetical protein
MDTNKNNHTTSTKSQQSILAFNPNKDYLLNENNLH